MENSLKALLLAASLILTCTILGLGFRLYGVSREMFGTMEQKLNGSEQEMWKREVLSYHGKWLYGSTVRYLVIKYKDRRMGFWIRTTEEEDKLVYDPFSSSASKQLVDEIMRKIIDYDRRYQVVVGQDDQGNVTGMWFVPEILK